MRRLAKGAARRLRRWLPAKARPAILMYHRIATDSFDPWGLAVEEEKFVGQIDWLSRNRTVMPLSEFAECQRTGNLPADAIAVTFDDGYACFLRAVPHLERLELPATIFISPDWIESGREFWWDELASIVFEFAGSALRLNGQGFRVPGQSDRDHIWPPDAQPATERQTLFQSIWAALRTKPPAALESALSQLRKQSAAAAPRESHRPLTAREIRTIGSTRFSFGSHALSHPSLPSLSDSDQLREIRDSRTRCAELAGEMPTAFAYPYGDFDARSVQLVRDAGFTCGCSTEGEFVTRKSNSFALPRLPVGNWDVSRFANMLGGR